MRGQLLGNIRSSRHSKCSRRQSAAHFNLFLLPKRALKTKTSVVISLRTDKFNYAKWSTSKLLVSVTSRCNHMRKKPSIVTIAIPTYNGARYVAQTIESVRRQKYSQLDIVVVDDGSTDDTLNVVLGIAEIDNRVRVFKQENGGIASARNKCFEMSNPKSEFIMFLDHDDILESDGIDLLVRALNDRQDCTAAHGKTKVVDDNSVEVELSEVEVGRLGLVRRKLSGDSFFSAFRRATVCDPADDTTCEMLLYSNCITSVGAALFRRSVLHEVGLFREEMVPVDDWDLYIRVSAEGPLCFIPQTVLQWRRHNTNTSSNFARMRDAHNLLMLDVASGRYAPSGRRYIMSLMLYRAILYGYLTLKRHRTADFSGYFLPAARVAVRVFLKF